MGIKYQLSGVNFIQMAGDILLLNLGIILAFLIRFNGQVPMINFEAYLKVLPFFLCLLFFFLIFLDFIILRINNGQKYQLL